MEEIRQRGSGQERKKKPETECAGMTDWVKTVSEGRDGEDEGGRGGSQGPSGPE